MILADLKMKIMYYQDYAPVQRAAAAVATAAAIDATVDVHSNHNALTYACLLFRFHPPSDFGADSDGERGGGDAI